MNPFEIPLAWKVGGVLAVVIALWAWHVTDKHAAATQAVDEYKREFTKAALKASENAREKELEANKNIDALAVALDQSNEQRKVDSRGAQLELKRLREYANSRPASSPEPTASTARVDASCGPELNLSTKLADVATKLAERADELEAQVVGLQNYALVAQKLCKAGQ